jgi:hypothetical protein
MRSLALTPITPIKGPKCQSCRRHFTGGESAEHVPGGRAGVVARVHRPAAAVA